MNDKQFQQLMHRLNSIAALLEALVQDGREQHAAVADELRDIYYKPGCTP